MPDNFVINKIKIEDVEQITILHNNLFPEKWPKASFIDYIMHDNMLNYKITEKSNQEILGFLLAQIIAPEAEIITLGVNEKHQKQGIGKILLRNLLKQLKSKDIKNLYLEVDINNNPAYNLYKKLNFEQISLRKNYYFNARNNTRSDAVVMCYNFCYNKK